MIVRNLKPQVLCLGKSRVTLRPNESKEIAGPLHPDVLRAQERGLVLIEGMEVPPPKVVALGGSSATPPPTPPAVSPGAATKVAERPLHTDADPPPGGFGAIVETDDNEEKGTEGPIDEVDDSDPDLDEAVANALRDAETTLGDDSGAVDPDADPDPLGQYSANDAVAYVRQVKDVAWLKRALSGEEGNKKRVTVVRAIKQRLEFLATI